MDKIWGDATDLREPALEAAVMKEMLDYLTRTGRKRTTGKKLLGARELVLQWYIEHGPRLPAVYTTIEYQPGKILAWLFDDITDARRISDTDKKAILQKSLNY